MKRIENMAVVVNTEKVGAEALCEQLCGVMEGVGTGYKIYREGGELPEGYLEGVDACCVIGGDGTLLGTVPEAYLREVPVFGVNLGKLGFLATFSVEEAVGDFEKILGGEYGVEKRCMLRVRVEGEEREYLGLNDVVLKHGGVPRLFTLEVYTGGELVSGYRGDGLIFATSTGSTAYNLSAGGPIIYPGADVFVMTPICAHTLTNRAMVLDDGMKIKVVCPEEGLVLQGSMDGGRGFEVGSGKAVHVEIAEGGLGLLQPVGYSHFDIMREKLGWSR